MARDRVKMMLLVKPPEQRYHMIEYRVDRDLNVEVMYKDFKLSEEGHKKLVNMIKDVFNIPDELPVLGAAEIVISRDMRKFREWIFDTDVPIGAIKYTFREAIVEINTKYGLIDDCRIEIL